MHVGSFVGLFALSWLCSKGNTGNAGWTQSNPIASPWWSDIRFYPHVQYTDVYGESHIHSFVYDCFGPSSTEGFPSEVRIGISVSVTHSSSELTKLEVEGMLNALVWWEVRTRSPFWNAGRVRFCVIDDLGNPQISQDAYMAFAGNETAQIAMATLLQPYVHPEPGRLSVAHHTKIATMDLLFGPSNYDFVKAAANIAHANEKLIVLWSHPSSFYALPHLPHCMPDLPQVGYRRLEESSPIRNSGAPVPRRLNTRVTQSSNMSMGSLSSPYLLDMNPRREEYGFSILDSIHAASKEMQQGGNSAETYHLHILDFLDDTCPLQELLTYATSLGFAVHVDQVNVSSISANGIVLELADHLRGFNAAVANVNKKRDGLLLCTSNVAYFQFYLTFCEALDIVPSAIISTHPGIFDALSEVYEEYPLLYFLEPRPFAFLSQSLGASQWNRDPKARKMSFYEFNESYQGYFNQKPTMMTIQMIAVSSVISCALWDRDYNDGSDTVSTFIKAIAQSYPVETFDGMKRFEENGICATCRAGIHQAFPRSKGSSAASTCKKSSLKIIPDVGYSANSMPSAWLTNASGTLRFPMPQWRQKLLEVYQCSRGCVARGQSCRACPRGKYRSESDLHCRECDSGRYTDVEASESCWPCPEGAVCNSTSSTPTADVGWFRISRAVSESTDQCSGRAVLERNVYVQCPGVKMCMGDNRCAADNVGMLCSNCRSGATFTGFSPNRRKCGMCPTGLLIAFRLFLLCCFFGVLLTCISRLTHLEAENCSSLFVPVLCLFLRHLQILGIIQSCMVIDRWEDSFFAEMPGILGSLVIQPFVVAQMDCAVHTSGLLELEVSSRPTFSQQEDQYKPHQVLHLCALLTLPIGIFLILAYHYSSRVFAFFGVMCRYGTSKSNPTFGKKDVMCLRAKRSEATLEAHVRLYAMPRQLIGWAFIALPVSVHASALLTSCHTIKGSEILVSTSNPDIRCTEEPYTTNFPIVIATTALSALPIVIGLLYAVLSSWHSTGTLNLRYTIGFITIGWRSQFCYYEVFLFCRTLLMAAVPIFFNGQEHVFFAQFTILFLTCVAQARLRPRVESDRHILISLEDVSVGALMTSLVLGWLMNVGMISKPLLRESMLPGFFTDNKITLLDLSALSHVFFIVRCCTAILWNKVILPMQVIYTVYQVVSGWGFCVLWFSNLLCGLNAVRLVLEKTSGNDMHSKRGYLDISQLNEREHRFFARFTNQVLKVCTDSRDRFNVGFVIGVLQETFQRAGESREARLNKNSGTVKNRLMRKHQQLITKENSRLQGLASKAALSASARVLRKPGTEASLTRHETNMTNRSHELTRCASISSMKFDMATHGITLDELYHAFLDVEYDVMSHEPAMHRILQAATGTTPFQDRSNGVFQSAHEKETEKDLPERNKRKSSVVPAETSTVMISNEFLSEVNTAMLVAAHNNETHTKYADMKSVLERNAETQSELSRLKQVLHKLKVAQMRIAKVSNKGKAVESGFKELFGTHAPALETDAMTLHADWAGDHRSIIDIENISSVMSPRARGIEKEALPVSFWDRWDAKSAKSMRKSNNSARSSAGPFQPLLHTQPHPSGGESVASTSAGVSPVAMGAGPGVDLDMYFDTPFRKVHQMLFKAMLLSSLRSTCGVSEEIISELKITLREGEDSILGPGIIARVSIPGVFVTEMASKDLLQLKVMDYPVRQVLRVDALQPPPTTPKTPTEVLRPPPLPPPAQPPPEAKASKEVSEMVQLIKGARFLAAKRILDAQGAGQYFLTQSQIESVTRIEQEFQQSLKSFQIGADWQSASLDAFNFQYGCKVGDDLFRYFLSADFEGGDPIHAVQAFSELDLHGGFDHNHISGRLLADHSPADTLWHVLRSVKELGSKEDNIVQLGIIDALDEAGAFFLFFSTPSDSELRSLRGVALPTPTVGTMRVAGSFITARIKPLQKSGSASLWGFNLTVVTCTRPSRMAYNFLWMMPPWGVLRVYRQMVQDFPAAFQKRLDELSGQKQDGAGKSPAWLDLFRRLQRRSVGFVPNASTKVASQLDSEEDSVPDLFPVVGAPNVQFL